ncbi:TetR family transcriptional regulator [Streptomyces chumphonensis]|uniref:TetR/AcrR family transcriptional regulator C-terminal domain-containing protein n=1 Tax=Streptomyces chumphonensis TaxID=1214925 RepID=A0A927IA21_9ACTN|nr:TetR/AcrR family transcriptional regulator C-terminal domain-containing protein [Streptomyces chumphonensis]
MVDAALELTREHGLDGWTIRQLATVLGTWPNTVAHHVGDREDVVAAVVQRVVATMPNPSPELGWQEWFRELLLSGRDVIGRYPGVARRLARDGATVPAALPIMDRGIGLLVSAGFGDRAPLAYGVLLNSAVLLIALDDDRRLVGPSAGEAATALMEMAAPAGAGTGWASLQPWLRASATDSGAVADALYRYTIESVLAGLQADLETMRPH